MFVAGPQPAPAGRDPAVRACGRRRARSAAAPRPGFPPRPRCDPQSRPSPSSTKWASAKAPAGSAPPRRRTRPVPPPGRKRQPWPTRPRGRSPRGDSRYLREARGSAQAAPGRQARPSAPSRPAPLTTWPAAGGGPAPAAAAPAAPWRAAAPEGSRPGGSGFRLPAPRLPEVPRASAGVRRRPRKCRASLPAPSRRPKMAPLDLDKYVEIARLCKYLPENDLKVRPGRGGRGGPGPVPAPRPVPTRSSPAAPL